MKRKPQTHPPAVPWADWIDKQEVRQWLHVSDRTLQRWRSQGLVMYSHIGGKLFYYRPHLEYRRQQGTQGLGGL